MLLSLGFSVSESYHWIQETEAEKHGLNPLPNYCYYLSLFVHPVGRALCAFALIIVFEFHCALDHNASQLVSLASYTMASANFTRREVKNECCRYNHVMHNHKIIIYW